MFISGEVARICKGDSELDMAYTVNCLPKILGRASIYFQELSQSYTYIVY